MKKIVSIITVLLAVLFVQAQTITQNGVSYRYNGKNPRTPIGGVYIKPVTADNGVVSNASNGSFSVVLKNLKMGSRIGNVKVTKQGMMVFNQQAVDEWNVRKDPLCLILCDANEFQKQKKNLIAIGERQAKKKYDKKLAELKKRNEAQQLQIDDYYNKLDSLEKEYQNALKHMDEYADVFARIDESEVDTLAQRAIELFNKGEIDESIHLFEQGNYMKKLDDALHTKAQAQNLRNVADSAEALADKDIEECVKSIKAQVSAYQVKNDYEKVGELLKGMADRLQTLDAIGSYLDFCNHQNKFKEIEKYSNTFLKIAESVPGQHKEILLVTLYYNLGVFYQKNQRFSDCEAMYNLALEACYRLSKENSEVYLQYLASVFNILGTLYRSTQRFSTSDNMYKAALEIRKQLAKDNPEDYEADLAVSYNDLGNLYCDTQRFDSCEIMYKAALEIRKQLAKENPKVYEPDLANSYNNLGVLYEDIQRFNDCETMHKAALEIRKRLAKDNPKVYEQDLANSYNNLGNLYCDTQRFDTCEIMYKAALEIRKRLVKENPKVYEPDLANSYNNIGELYYNIQRFCDCETMYKAALEIRKRLAKDSPKNYEPDLAISYNNLGALYHQTRNFIECEAAYKSALSILEHLSKDNPKVYEPDLAISYNNLGNLYRDTQRFTDSEIMLNFCSKIYSNLYEDNPLLYRKGFAYICYSLGISRIKNKKTKEAINAFEKSLTIIINGKEKEKSELLYTENLAELSVLYSAEKKYETAYNYNTELLELRKNYYFAEPANYKNDYSSTLVNQSFNANLLGKFKEGETYCLEALQVDSTKHIAYTNLAAALLFQGKIEEAEKIYRQYKSEFKDGFLDDFAEYERLQVIPKEYMADVERIKAMLQE